ncbi:YkgJ family cysteine cluster protein [Candidatus Woesearchaeota archaeon]|nr:YkgJ family cysteine cluster protein [Candidatus Woesearchaeota archaeon]
MASYFKCGEGCVKCCGDNNLLIDVTARDMVRISASQGISLLDFYDSSLVARLAGSSNEVQAYLRMPCPYIGETEKGIIGCTIHDIKPDTCKLAPEDRMVFSGDLPEWGFCRLKRLTKKRLNEINRIGQQKYGDELITRVLLYTPKIVAPEHFIERHPVFRDALKEEPDSSELMRVITQIVDSEYRDIIRQRVESLQEMLEEKGTLESALNSMHRKRQFRKVYKSVN